MRKLKVLDPNEFEETNELDATDTFADLDLHGPRYNFYSINGVPSSGDTSDPVPQKTYPGRSRQRLKLLYPFN